MVVRGNGYDVVAMVTTSGLHRVGSRNYPLVVLSWLLVSLLCSKTAQ